MVIEIPIHFYWERQSISLGLLYWNTPIYSQPSPLFTYTYLTPHLLPYPSYLTVTSPPPPPNTSPLTPYTSSLTLPIPPPPNWPNKTNQFYPQPIHIIYLIILVLPLDGWRFHAGSTSLRLVHASLTPRFHPTDAVDHGRKNMSMDHGGVIILD